MIIANLIAMITVVLPVSDYPVIRFNLGCVSNDMIYVNGPDEGKTLYTYILRDVC